MVPCSRCHHLNPRTEQYCELCGSELPVSAGAKEPPRVNPTSASGTNKPAAPQQPPLAAPPSDSPPASAANSNPDPGNSGQLSSLLDALEQDSDEGRARGEGRRERGYFLNPLPIPDDMPVPNLTRSTPPKPREVKPPPLQAQQATSSAQRAGAASAQRPSAAKSGPAARQPISPPASASADDNQCQQCGSLNPPANRFCGECGGRIALKPAAAPAPKLSFQATLVCINEDGSDGEPSVLSPGEKAIGRSTDPRFASDLFLSPRHAHVLVDQNGVYIEDLQSLNGTFLRIRDKVRLNPGDCFLMGRQVLKLERLDQQINSQVRGPDGTRYMGSPIPGGKYKLIQLGIGGIPQNVYCLSAEGAILGRERGDIVFSSDKFMSAKHAQVVIEPEDQVLLLDINSSNGTWIKINQRHPLSDQDYIFLGQQLFRIGVSS